VKGGCVRLSVVVPAYNEAGRIRQTLEELLAHLHTSVPDYEIRVVDDGSEDETATIVESIAESHPEVVLQREPHRGKGWTVRAGLLAATGELRFMCDADLSMPLAELQRLLAVVPAQCDIAVGTREGTGARRIGEPTHRHLMGRVFNACVRAMVLPGIGDTQCGFKLFTSQAVEAVFPMTTIRGWAFDVEVLHIARLRGLAVQEVPIEWHYRHDSKVSAVRDPLGMIRDLWRIRLNGMRGAYSNKGQRPDRT
jgi:dolichyl-phosphate beta-glucosyltransferase